MEQRLTDMRADVATLQTKVAMLDQSQRTLEETVTRMADRTDRLIDLVTDLDRTLSVVVTKLEIVVNDTRQNETWIRENWTKLVEFGAILTFITKSLDIW